MSQESPEFEIGELIYENPLSGPEDVEDWVIESSREGHPEMWSVLDERLGLISGVHFLLWCPKDFPDNIAVSWEFKPGTDEGLAMFWIAATGEDGKDLFDPSLTERDGTYNDYLRGDINALHVAYYRRNTPWKHDPSKRGGFHEINFQTCSLRKSTVDNHGPRVAEGADPLPSAARAKRLYQMQVIKYGPYFRFSIEGLTIIDWKDDGTEGPILEGGKIGFQQMRGLIGQYSNLEVREVELKDDE